MSVDACVRRCSCERVCMWASTCPLCGRCVRSPGVWRRVWLCGSVLVVGNGVGANDQEDVSMSVNEFLSVNVSSSIVTCRSASTLWVITNAGSSAPWFDSSPWADGDGDAQGIRAQFIDWREGRGNVPVSGAVEGWCVRFVYGGWRLAIDLPGERFPLLTGIIDEVTVPVGMLDAILWETAPSSND